MIIIFYYMIFFSSHFALFWYLGGDFGAQNAPHTRNINRALFDEVDGFPKVGFSKHC